MKNNLTFIDTQEALKNAYQIWKDEKELGIDIECENNLHHYGTYIALIQISSRTQHWIVDVLKLKKIEPLIKILEAKKILKIFHDVSFDLRILGKQFGCRAKNVFDTQVAALLAGKADLGLGALLKEYFGVEKKKKYQMADWTKRPIKKEMLEYASKDTRYLLRLKDVLSEELKKLGRLEWAEEEFDKIENTKYEYNEFGFWDIKGLHDIDERSRAILKHLFELRDKFARSRNRPVHFIISTKRLKDIACNPPNSHKFWSELKGVHPIVKTEAKRFQEAIEMGYNEKLRMPRKEIKRFSQNQKDVLDELDILRKNVAEKLKMRPHLILGNEQMKDILITCSANSLRKWQKEVLGKALDEKIEKLRG